LAQTLLLEEKEVNHYEGDDGGKLLANCHDAKLHNAIQNYHE
jgi:hypothetical protein